jgi:hypothetical protein
MTRLIEMASSRVVVSYCGGRNRAQANFGLFDRFELPKRHRD